VPPIPERRAGEPTRRLESEVAQGAGGIADDNRTGVDLSCSHNSAGSHDHIVADMAVAQHLDPGSYPNVVANNDWHGLNALLPQRNSWLRKFVISRN
jgi:hypothetical protein